MINNYKVIIITSILSPWELYKNKTEEDRKQWIRRLNIYKIENGKIKKVENEEDEEVI